MSTCGDAACCCGNRLTGDNTVLGLISETLCFVLIVEKRLVLSAGAGRGGEGERLGVPTGGED